MLGCLTEPDLNLVCPIWIILVTNLISENSVLFCKMGEYENARSLKKLKIFLCMHSSDRHKIENANN